MSQFSFSHEETRKAEDRLSDRLQKLLTLLYWLKINRRDCIHEGSLIIDEEYKRIIDLINKEISANDFTTIPEIHYKDYLERVKRDWPRIVEEAPLKPEPSEPDGTTINRVTLIAWFLIHHILSDASVQVAKNEGAIFLEWRSMRDENVCVICLGLEGFYSLTEPLPEEPHLGCRCRWIVWFVVPRTDAIDSRAALANAHRDYMRKIMSRN